MNTTAIQFKVGDKVIPSGYTKSNVGVGYVRQVLEPIGTAGEWNYAIYWTGLGGEGTGWRDCDLQPVQAKGINATLKFLKRVDAFEKRSRKSNLLVGNA